MRVQRFLLAAMTLMTVAVIAPAAASAQPQWTLRLRGLYSDYTRDARTAYFSSASQLEFDSGQGVEVAAEFRPSPRVGVELSASRLSLDARYRQFETRPISFNPLVFEEREVSSDSGHFDLEPIALTLLIHPLRARRVDLYIGPQIAFTHFNVDVGGIPDRDSEFAYGGKLGAELRLGDSPWTAGLDFRHLQVVHEATDRDIYANIGVNVLSFGFGLHLGGGAMTTSSQACRTANSTVEGSR